MIRKKSYLNNQQITMNKSVRNATKKLKTYQSKHPGVTDEKHEELRRNVIIAKLSVARREQKEKKAAERHRFNAITDDEFLDQSFQQNATLNSEKTLATKKSEKNNKKKKHDHALMRIAFNKLSQPYHVKLAAMVLQTQATLKKLGIECSVTIRQ